MHKKTKNITRIFYLIFTLAAVIALLCPIRAFADEKPAEGAEGLEIGATLTDAESGEKDNGAGFFDSLFTAFEDNLSQILSAATFIGSLLIMLCYKRGLLPLVKDGLGALASGVRSISEKTNELNLGASDITEKLNGRLESTERLLCSMQDTVESLGSKLDELDAEREERRMLRTVLSAEVDMLYEIFNSAALPQYLKDRVGERIAQMRKELSGGDTRNEEN